MDPRCKILFFRPSPYDPGIKDDYKAEDPNAEYGGYRNGAKEVGSKYTVKYSPMKTNLKSDEMLPDCWWNQAREIIWLGYSESLFLKAEAALRGWGNETGATVAGRLYEEGVRASSKKVVQEKNNWNKSLHKNGWLSILTVTKVGLRFAAQIIPVICCCRVMATTQAVRWRIPN